MKTKKSQTKFSNDLIWNVFGFGGIVLIGILINVIILNFYDANALGVFNQVYAIYILLSQLAVGGVHLAIQYFVPKSVNDSNELNNLLITALFSSFLTGILFIGIGYLAVPYLGRILGSSDVADGLNLTLWGLFFFSFNKIILSFLNGLREMKKFALFQFLRFFLMISSLFVLLYFESPMKYIATILAISECILFVILIFVVFKYLKINIGTKLKETFSLQFKFGNKVLLGNFLLDINTKIDIFTLGVFMSDYWVGIYSFAATIAEGFMQLSVLLRNNINPIITRLHSNDNLSLMTKVLRKNKRLFFKYTFVLGVLSILGFPIFGFIAGVDELLIASVIYAVLIGGFVISGGYQPFLMIFNQVGLPKTHTLFIFIICISNILFNILLVPTVGAVGAAIGTAISFIVQLIAMKILIQKKIGIKI
uniref:oligosaccharide flippase family protein n=2 Tax=Flavobacterium sp. TaxID=239 RepID=UPI0040492084